MKVIARIFLFLFVAFLSMPVILTVIEKSANTSMFFNCSEEEHVQKEGVSFTYDLFFQPIITLQFVVKKATIHVASFEKYDKISRIIFSPPPNFL